MNYNEKIVTRPAFSKSVLCYWEMTGEIQPLKIIESRFIPKGQNLLIFNFGDPASLPQGVHEKALSAPFFVFPAVVSSQLIQQKGKIDLFGVSFIGEGLYQLMQTPVGELLNHFPEKLQLSYRQLHKSLATCDFEKKCELMEAFLLERIKLNPKKTTFSKALQEINRTKGGLKLTDLTTKLDVSQRQLQRLFKTRLGISPKDYCKIVRVNSYLQFILEKEGNVDYMDLVVAFDYHDQPHLINELKTITQLSPRKLIQYRDTLYHHYHVI